MITIDDISSIKLISVEKIESIKSEAHTKLLEMLDCNITADKVNEYKWYREVSKVCIAELKRRGEYKRECLCCEKMINEKEMVRLDSDLWLCRDRTKCNIGGNTN